MYKSIRDSKRKLKKFRQKFVLSFGHENTWIRIRLRISTDLKCWIRIRIDINTDPKHCIIFRSGLSETYLFEKGVESGGESLHLRQRGGGRLPLVGRERGPARARQALHHLTLHHRAVHLLASLQNIPVYGTDRGIFKGQFQNAK